MLRFAKASTRNTIDGEVRLIFGFRRGRLR
jgi:hypothetical protein